MAFLFAVSFDDSVSDYFSKKFTFCFFVGVEGARHQLTYRLT